MRSVTARLLVVLFLGISGRAIAQLPPPSPTCPVSPPPETMCADACDNDRDGPMDCADPDCLPFCAPPPAGFAPPPPAGAAMPPPLPPPDGFMPPPPAGIMPALWDETALTAWTHTPWLEVLPDTDLSAVSVRTVKNPAQLFLRLTPGEYGPLSLSITALRDLSGLAVSLDDFKSASSSLAKTFVDVRVVKVWEQAGRGKIVEETDVLVPELLLYNDEDSLAGSWAEPGSDDYIAVAGTGVYGWTDTGLYVPPSISTTLSVNIPKDTTKTLWFTIHVPDAQPAGNYTTRVKFMEGETLLGEVPLTVNVLPFTLDDASDKDFVPYVGWIGSELEYEQQLPDLFSHGVNGTISSYYGYNMDMAGNMAKFQSLGFRGPFVQSYIANFSTLRENEMSALENAGYESYLYGYDEPNSDANMALHLSRSRKIHSADGKVVTAILKQNADRLDDPNDAFYDLTDADTGKTFREEGATSEALDIANYHANYLQDADKGLDEPLWEYIQSLRDGTGTKTGKKEYIYWQMWVEKPLLNRIMPGFFFATSGLDGVAPFTYSWIFDKEVWGDPFNDRDGTKGVTGSSEREMLTVYPSQEGPIPTTKWEAFREGITDYRYAATLSRLLDERAGDPAVAAIRDELAVRLAKFFDPYDLNELTGDDFDETRRWIQEQILRLKMGM